MAIKPVEARPRAMSSPEHMKNDDDLKALCGRDDFNKLFAELETKLQK
jgi:hypothetical protein